MLKGYLREAGEIAGTLARLSLGAYREGRPRDDGHHTSRG